MPQALGDACAGVATLILLLPLHRLLRQYATTHINDDRWVTPALRTLVPLWLLLMGALLCVSLTGGFDWLSVGRVGLYALTGAASLALGAVTFVFVGLFIRPGFTPRGLYRPVITFVPLATIVFVVLSLHPQLVPGPALALVQRAWTIGAGVSVAIGATALVYWLARSGRRGVAGVVHALRHRGPSSREILSQVEALDPEAGFDELLRRTSRGERRDVREAAVARLRAHPDWVERLCAELKSGAEEPAMSFLREADLTPEERARLATPARAAMQRWVARIPAPNFTTPQHLRALRRWGLDVLSVLPQRFAGTGVDFAPVVADFKEKVQATRHV